MSFYLKYRPQKTTDLDIGAVRDFYAALIKSGKFSHAYLFSGPRGTGKTSSARILAKLVNCEENKKAVGELKPLNEPCGKCEMCRRITVGSSLSVVEMDAASNRGIDDIRSLRERIALAPAEGSFVVYIIDEVHMLTTEAFNALLKTLEEPPEHAIFALCTTELHKLPETVVSRCTQVMYPKATVEEVKESLAKVIKTEKIDISDASLLMLAEAADGSFRDGMKMLEQLVSSGSKVEDILVETLVKRTTQYDPIPLIDFMLKKDAKKSMEILSLMDEEGVDVSVFARRILDELRTRMLRGMEKGSKGLENIMKLTELMAKAALEVKTAYISTLPLEILVAKWCFEVTENSSSITQVDGSGRIPQSSGFSRNPRTLRDDKADYKSVSALSNVNQNSDVSRENSGRARMTESKIFQGPSSKSKVQIKREYKAGDLKHEEIERRWGEVLAAVKPLNHSLEALLRSSRPKETNGSEIIVEVFYKFHKDRLEEEKHRSSIEQVMSDIFKSKVRLNFVLGNAKNIVQKVSEIASESKSLSENELVKAAEEIFG